MSGDPGISRDVDSLAVGLALIHKKSVSLKEPSHYLDVSQLTDFYRLVISSEDSYVSWFSAPGEGPAGFACGFLDLQRFNKRTSRVLSRGAMLNPRLAVRLLLSGLVSWRVTRAPRNGAGRRGHLGMIAVDHLSEAKASDRNLFSCVGDVHQWFIEKEVQLATASTRNDNIEALALLQALGYEPVREFLGVVGLEKQM